jgi:hypothetical protein
MWGIMAFNKFNERNTHVVWKQNTKKHQRHNMQRIGMLAQNKEQRDPIIDRSTKDNKLYESIKNKMVRSRDKKIKLGEQ